VGYILNEKAFIKGLFEYLDQAGNFIFVKRGSQLIVTGLFNMFQLGMKDLLDHGSIEWYASNSRFGPFKPFFFSPKDFSYPQTKKRLRGQFRAGLEKGKLGPNSYVNKVRLRVPHK
jgi:hypothetical protein